MIGGGFIGSELAAALAMNGKQAVMIFPEKVINGARFPPDLGDYLNTFYRDKGVNVAAEHEVTNVEPRGETLVVTAKHRQDNTTREFAVDGVIAGIGILPNIELAQAAGIRVEDGIVVDEYLRTHQPDIYAAGDVAMVYRPLLGKAARIEHEDNANAMGRAAGRNMAGAQERFTYQPYFYSDLFDLGYEAVGDFSPGLEMIAEWQEPYQRGVIYYLGDGRVRGVVLWNVWERRDAARALIAEPGPFDAKNVKGRIALGK